MQHLFSNKFRQSGLINNIALLATGFLFIVIFSFSTCKYSFKDTSPIPPDVKTFRVNFLENKARFVNPLLSPQLTENLKQKIRSNTRLTQVNADSANYDISGYVSDYTVSTSGISGDQANTNLLTVSFHLVFKNNLDLSKNFEADISSGYNFSASQNIAQVEPTLTPDIVKNTVDGIFNKIFSNW
jgi:outer membrane lipopolysaccharide assembly protein LptE/RlpB